MSGAEPSRRTVGAIGLGALAIAAGLLAGVLQSSVRGGVATPPERAARPVAPLRQPGAAPAGQPAAARRRPPDGARASPAAASAATVARRFVAGYLEYSYGWQTPLPAATAALRRELLGAPPLVPKAVRRRRPRLVSLTVVALNPLHERALAIVADGHAPYEVELDLAGTPAGWLVDAVEPAP